MIGAVLHLMGRVVDRVAGADVASLRVKVAALSARVVAAEGEVERLRHRLWEADARAVSLQEKIDDWDRRYLEADRGNFAAETKLKAERDEARAEVERLRGLARAYKAAEDAYYAAKGDARTPARAVLHEAVDNLFAAIPKEAP